ncbi:MAG: alpha/beta hydrolase [Albidovulum sp.]
MTAKAAPFFADVAEAPAGVSAHWLTSSDGTRIRAAFWPEGAKGTVLLFPGRTEYIEKYGPAAADLAARGYAMLTLDWRGQGLSDRPLANSAIGHVKNFLDFQMDILAALDLARAQGLPEPYFLIAHSMGGTIGLRAIYRDLPVRAAAFSAPMWGIRIHPVLRPAAWGLSCVGRMINQSHHLTPGTSLINYVLEAPFADNVLTRDPEMYAFLQRQVTVHPELSLGGPSLHWLNEALRECYVLGQMPSPALPCVTALGCEERVVDSRPIRKRMAHWPAGQLDMVPGAEHEVMMEGAALRKRFFDTATALFDAQL